MEAETRNDAMGTSKCEAQVAARKRMHAKRPWRRGRKGARAMAERLGVIGGCCEVGATDWTRRGAWRLHNARSASAAHAHKNAPLARPGRRDSSGSRRRLALYLNLHVHHCNATCDRHATVSIVPYSSELSFYTRTTALVRHVGLPWQLRHQYASVSAVAAYINC